VTATPISVAKYSGYRADAGEAANEARSCGQRRGRTRVSIWLQIGHQFSADYRLILSKKNATVTLKPHWDTNEDTPAASH
jgi:hypothetical protein